MINKKFTNYKIILSVSLLLIIGLFSNNVIWAMENNTQSRMDNDLLYDVNTYNFDQRLETYLNDASLAQRQEFMQRISTIAENIVDNIGDEELNIPQENRAIEILKKAILFIALSFIGYMLIKHGPAIRDYIIDIIPGPLSVSQTIQRVHVVYNAASPEVRQQIQELLSTSIRASTHVRNPA